jgi:TRAP-type mannitol/chloroaromatic compound transport system permease small subunit
VLISTVNAVLRKAFDLGSNAWFEMQLYLYAAAFLLAAGYVLLSSSGMSRTASAGSLR